jgi:hypothetical protein
MITSERVRVSVGAVARECARSEAMDVAGQLLAETGSSYKDLVFSDVTAGEARFSEFGSGKQIVDAAAMARIEGQHAALAAAGIAVDAGQQLFATGTRMAVEGYATQTRRAQEHVTGTPIADVLHALSTRVQEERREDVEVSSSEFADTIEINGAAKAFGFKLTEQALRGLCARLESPSIRYLLGLRDRIAGNLTQRAIIGRDLASPETGVDPGVARSQMAWLRASIEHDKAHLAETLRRECRANPDVKLKLRARRGVGDIFAIVSPSYTPADAPEVVAEIAEHLPGDAIGTWAYDPESTAWEIRADIWTPTPVAEQAVGEAFRGYASFFGRDNGTGRFGGGGGIELLRCLNASTYTVDTASASRVHRANVLTDLDALVQASMRGIEALAAAWGTARDVEVALPAKVTIEDAIPGFWRYLLRDQRSELQGVIPGRSEKHVEGLTAAYFDERREPSRIVRADFAQGWTRYIQDQPAATRRVAEQAIGNWVVSDRKVGFLAE